MRSSARSIEHFAKSALWMDIQEILKDWADGVKELPYNTKEDSTREERIDEYVRCEGRLEALNYFLGIPETLLNALEYEEGHKDGTGHDQTGG